MSKIIAELTPHQQSLLSVYRDKWIEIGLSTDPANKEEAEKAINGMYRSAGLKPPKKIVWCGSPLSQGLTRAIILDKNNSVRDSVRDSVWASVGDSVGASVWASVRDSVRDSVWASVGDSVWASVRDSVRDSVWASVGASVRASVWDSGYGQHDAFWLSFYAFFREEVGLTDQTEKLVHHFQQAKNAGWYLPHEHICWVSERHHLLLRDDRGRLHNTSGPAIMYPDGWKIYAIRGVRLPEFVVERPHEITVSTIEGENNAEVRRIMIDRFGIQRYVKDSGSKVVSQCNDNHPILGLRTAELYRKELPGDEPIVMLDMLNSSEEPDGSRKRYLIRIDPNAYDGLAAKDCLAAMASTYRLPNDELLFKSPGDYNPLIES